MTIEPKLFGATKEKQKATKKILSISTRCDNAKVKAKPELEHYKLAQKFVPTCTEVQMRLQKADNKTKWQTDRQTNKVETEKREVSLRLGHCESVCVCFDDAFVAMLHA